MDDVEGVDQLGLASDLLSAYSPWAMIGGLVFGLVGIYLFRAGKKNSNLWWVWSGVVMFIYPLFTTTGPQTWGVGLALCALCYFKK